LIDPTTNKGSYGLVEPTGRSGPLHQKIPEILQTEEIVPGDAQYGRRATNGATGFHEVGRAVGRSALFADVAVLVGRSALGAGALNVPVWEEPSAFLTIVLFNLSLYYMSFVFAPLVDGLAMAAVLRGVRGVKMVETYLEASEILLMLSMVEIDQFLGTDSPFFGVYLDRRAMRIRRAQIYNVTAY
jgi:hypothetical protein